LRINLYKSKLSEADAPAVEPSKLENKTSSKNLKLTNSGITKM